MALPSTEEGQSQEVESAIDLPALVGASSTMLFHVAHSVLRSRHESEDVVQDVFVRVLEHRRSLPEVREMRVWLIRIAWNLALDRRRIYRPPPLGFTFAREYAGSQQDQPKSLNPPSGRRI